MPVPAAVSSVDRLVIHFLSCCLLLLARTVAATDTSPNIILILSDDVGAEAGIADNTLVLFIGVIWLLWRLVRWLRG
jgi:hypothetical protein